MNQNHPLAIWESLHELTNLLKIRMMAQLHRLHPDMSFLEMRTIIMVGAQPDITQKELIEKIQMDKAQMARMLSTMEASQWVHRHTDQSDRRIRRLKLSPKGQVLYAQIQIWRHDLASEAFEFWPLQSHQAIESTIKMLKNKNFDWGVLQK